MPSKKSNSNELNHVEQGREEKILVIVPTHSNSETLEFALRSIAGQTYENFEVAIIGDGASPSCVSTAQAMVGNDKRFSLYIHPKSERRGEQYRHEVISLSSANYICYLADDDLFLPEHLEVMRTELKGLDFVATFPAFINRRDEVWCMPTDLSLKSNRQWHLSKPIKNSISLSGVMHTMSAYKKLDEGWATTPSSFAWTDLFMWQKFIRREDLKMKTSRRSTVLKFLGGSNDYDSEKVQQNARWAAMIITPGWSSEWDEMVERARQQFSAELFVSQPEYRSSVEIAKELAFSIARDFASVLNFLPSIVMRPLKAFSARKYAKLRVKSGSKLS